MTRKASPAQARAAAMAIVRRLRDAGHIAYFAGGCVRDELLGLSPTDYDVATDAPPDRIRSMFRRTQEVGAAFGVVLVTPTEQEGAQAAATVEVATFRSEGPYSDRRRPDTVTFSDPRSDAQRRDFTVNALFLDPMAPTEASVIDFVGGLPDLKRRVIRAVGDPEARLAEDHLRALRAVRFAARLGFELDPATAAAIRGHARELAGVSRERIGDEVRRMLDHPSRDRAVAMLEELGLDAPVLDEPSRTSARPIMSALRPEPVPMATALAAWALDRGLDIARSRPGLTGFLTRWRKALCLSNEDREALARTLNALAVLEGTWDSLPIAAQKRLAGGDGPAFAGALRLLAARNPARATAVQTRVDSLSASPGGLSPHPILTGDDLVGLGLAPGPRFKVILDRVYNAQLEGSLASREQAIAMARELDRGMGV